MTAFASRMRFLPATIFAAALMLTVKVGTIWEGVGGLLDGTLSVAGAQAQQPKSSGPPADKPAAAQSGPAQAQQKDGGEAASTDNPTAPGAATAARLARDDPTLLTQAEIDLLQQLAERRENLDAREQELDIQSGLLTAAETRIDKKVKELKTLQAAIAKLIKSYDDQQNAKLQSLVKIYENMKPKDAARIFGELDMDTLLMVAERMKERKLAPIMAKMDPTKATEITVELSRLRQMPAVGDEAGG
jgi:flagellar motility protein MotE (MotC chaperone)